MDECIYGAWVRACDSTKLSDEVVTIGDAFFRASKDFVKVATAWISKEATQFDLRKFLDLGGELRAS